MVDRPIQQEAIGVPSWLLELPEEEIRAGIESMPPGARQDQAYSDWARARILKEQEGKGPDPSTGVDWSRSFLRGVPGVGSFADEGTAAVRAMNPLSKSTYAEEIPYWRQRDQGFERQHPQGDELIALTTGVLSPQVGRIGSAANIALNTGLGALGGFGRGEGSPLTEEGVKSRISGALAEGAATGVLSSLFGPVSRWMNRYSQGNVTPEVTAALDRLNMSNTPYFVSATNPRTQAQGRRLAQVDVDSNLNRSFNDTRDQYGRAASEAVRRTPGVGTTPDIAPWSTGQTINEALRRSSEGATRSAGVLADETNRLMPGGAIFDPAGQRAALDEVIQGRAGQKMAADRQARGLGDHQAFSDGPVSWEGSNAYTTTLGDTIGLPANQDSVPTRELRRIYAGHQGTDRPNFVEQALGSGARTRFEDVTRQQKGLFDMQRNLDALLNENPTPEGLVQSLLSGGSTKGGPTNLNAVNLILDALSTPERTQAAAGVLSQIINQSQVQTARGTQVGTATNPGAVADAINRIVPHVRDALFPRGAQLGDDAEALRLVGQRVGQVNQLRNVGSAQTQGDKMQQVPWMQRATRLSGFPQVKSAIESPLALNGLWPQAVEFIDRLGTTGARELGAGASPYVQGAAPYVTDQIVQLKNMLPR